MRNVFLLLLLLATTFLTACGTGETDDGDNANDPKLPYFDPIGTQTVTAGQTMSFTVVAHDPNGGNLTLTYDGTLGPNQNPFTFGANFNSTNGNFAWTTDAGDVGNYSVQFTATNDAVPPLSGSVNITLRVLAVTSTTGQSLYVQHCQRCHGVDGAGGSTFGVQCSNARTITEALGLSAMSGISLTTQEIQDIAMFLEGFC